MITTNLVGDDAVLAWLRATPDVAASTLAGAIAKLGIDLQRRIQEDDLTSHTLAARSGWLKPSIDLQIDQSGDETSATVFSGSQYARDYKYGIAGTADIKANLRRRKAAFESPISEKTTTTRAYRRRTDLPERSYLRAVLEDMDPAIRDEVEAALREALTR